MRFEAKEMTVQGRPNIFGDKNADRQFVFDAGQRHVTLQSKTASGKLKSLELPLGQTADKKHLVFLSWNPNGCSLVVDGEGKQDYDDEAKQP
jgi:hypothetical protein